MAWDSLGLETVEALCHQMFSSTTSLAVSASPVYLAGDESKLAADAAALSVEWLHPSRLEHTFESRAALLLTEYLDSGRWASRRRGLGWGGGGPSH